MYLIMFTYDHLQSKTRSGPEALLQIYNPSISISSQDPHDVKAIVDSGAVITCIPKSIIDRLGKNLEYSIVNAQGFNGSSIKIEKKLVRLTIVDNQGQKEYDKEIHVLAVPGKEYALIGRDILDEHKVVLNAPERIWRLNCRGSCD